jgi:hypothetical protein
MQFQRKVDAGIPERADHVVLERVERHLFPVDFEAGQVEESDPLLGFQRLSSAFQIASAL